MTASKWFTSFTKEFTNSLPKSIHLTISPQNNNNIWSSSYITVTIHICGMTKKKLNQANGSRFFDKEIKFTLSSLLTEP